MEDERRGNKRDPKQPQRILVSLEIPKQIVLDTTALVNHLRSADQKSIVTRLEGKTQLATTIINIFELYYGAYKSREVKRNLAAVKGLRSTLQVFNLTEASAERAGKILAHLEAKGRPLDPRDLFVASICLEQGFAVLTDNTEHFKRIPELETLPEKELSKALEEETPKLSSVAGTKTISREDWRRARRVIRNSEARTKESLG